MVSPAASDLAAFQWQRQPAAEAVVQSLVRDFLGRCPAAAKLAERMHVETGTRFVDWIDTIAVAGSRLLEAHLQEAGFVRGVEDAGFRVFCHAGGLFPRVLVGGGGIRVSIKTDSVADFLAANSLDVEIEGLPHSFFRRATIARQGEACLEVVERRGWSGQSMPAANSETCLGVLHFLEKFRTRRRLFDEELDGFGCASDLIDDSVGRIGVDPTCAIFFAAEREYWQRRNRAAQVQKSRQDRLGLGWGNHDHHTYRSSRAYFRQLVAIFEKLGLHCRERFYAGREAGWGAQVMENPRAGIVVFADVDLAAEELMGDFAHEPLQDRDRLGTVGLWCGLHGEAFLQAGMHHLECQFDFEALKRQLESEQGISVMKPFTDFPFLRQAFTAGERWAVDAGRVRRLREQGLITDEQAKQFAEGGAIGSHLENLERNEGYKGFNEQGVSEIIAATDPRKNVVGA